LVNDDEWERECRACQRHDASCEELALEALEELEELEPSWGNGPLFLIEI
jgi:hypothetical protein